MKWYLKALNKYATFSGRARRKEYWMFAAFNTFFMLIILLLFCIIASLVESIDVISFAPFGLLAYSLAVVIPGLGVTIRRLHDTGRSGWMVFVALIPLIGSIWLLVLLLKDSVPEENGYGADPKAAERAEGKNSIQRAAAFLVVTSLFWVFSFVNGLMMRTSYENSIGDLASFITHILFIIVPISLLFLAAALLDRKDA